MSPSSSAIVTSIVFVCIFGGALFGMFLRNVLPANHLRQDSLDVVNRATGLIVTLAALVLGLLIGSAKSTYDSADNEITQRAASIVLLDRALTRYGPETREIREVLRHAVANKLATTWPEEAVRPASTDRPEAALRGVEAFDDMIRALSPQTDTQRSLQAEATSLADDVLRGRWLVFGEAGNAVQMTPVLVVMVFWLVAIFVGFGLSAPRNGTVVIVFVVAALSVSASIFLILELNHPLEGLLKVSSAPVRAALSHLGQ